MESILPVFVLVILGFILRKTGFIAAEQWRVVEELCFWIFFPALLAYTLIKADFGTIQTTSFSLALLFSMATIIVILLAGWPLLRSAMGVTRSQYSTIFQTTSRWHGFIALAIVLELYGGEGATLVAFAFMVMVPVLQVINLVVLAFFSGSVQPEFSRIISMLVRNPIIWGVIVGMIINLAALSLWNPLLTILDLLADAALGCSLLVLGAGLSVQAALHSSRVLIAPVLGKLILTPLVFAGYAFVFSLTGVELSVFLICASVPAAMNGYVLARKMGGDAQLYASVTTVQTALSFITLPIVIWIARDFLGGQ